jgi:hypothetical protein
LREIRDTKSDRLDRDLTTETGCHEDGYDDTRQDNGSGKTTRKAERDDQALTIRLDAYNSFIF